MEGQEWWERGVELNPHLLAAGAGPSRRLGLGLGACPPGRDGQL
ncbi:hypothetical protein [Streptomyces noursei]|nr:hypothetical protein [Streptomyces noursei]MCZ0972128.1 hypothetical protein [Streptomyces noursei]